MENLNELQANAVALNAVHIPQILRITNADEKLKFDNLIANGEVLFVHDEMLTQLQELIKGQNPSIRIPVAEYPERIKNYLNGRDINQYGVWVYYPWNRRIVHLLDKEEFIEVRTNRNQYKITKAERDILLEKKIGIVGLSVGQSIALTISMERGCGELRLADFDTLELSNLNRIRTGLHNLGVPKVVIAAREIAEIDPFINVKCFFDGLTEANIDDFFLKDGKLDLLVDECDGLDIKIISRFKARELRVPVLMDTSDRGMLDVERFDLEPDRPLLHGTVENINPQIIKGLTNEEKIPIILQMLGVDNISLRGKASMLEVEQTINTWPQLASSVVLGGAVGADVSRRILLGHYNESGRYYIDLEELVGDKKPIEEVPFPFLNPFKPLSEDDMVRMADSLPVHDGKMNLDKSVIEELVTVACAAPSTGNDQPWKWLYKNGRLNLFHDQYRSFSFGDYQKIASFISFGAAFENLYIRALNLGLEANCQLFPLGSEPDMVASITFSEASALKDEFLSELDNAISERHTNRNTGVKVTLADADYEYLKKATESIAGAEIRFFKSEDDLKTFGKIIGACDRIRLLNPAGHYDFVHREMRWTSEDATNKRDGIDVKTLGFSNSQLAALGILKNEKVINTIKNLDGGYALDMLAKKNLESASALCMITLPEYNLPNYFEGGRAMERFWLAAQNLNIAVNPMISPFYLFPRMLHGGGEGLDYKNAEEIQQLRKEFNKLTGLGNNGAEVFLTKISKAPLPDVKSFRLNLNDVLIIK